MDEREITLKAMLWIDDCGAEISFKGLDYNSPERTLVAEFLGKKLGMFVDTSRYISKYELSPAVEKARIKLIKK